MAEKIDINRRFNTWKERWISISTDCFWCTTSNTDSLLKKCSFWAFCEYTIIEYSFCTHRRNFFQTTNTHFFVFSTLLNFLEDLFLFFINIVITHGKELSNRYNKFWKDVITSCSVSLLDQWLVQMGPVVSFLLSQSQSSYEISLDFLGFPLLLFIHEYSTELFWKTLEQKPTCVQYKFRLWILLGVLLFLLCRKHPKPTDAIKNMRWLLSLLNWFCTAESRRHVSTVLSVCSKKPYY